MIRFIGEHGPALLFTAVYGGIRFLEIKREKRHRIVRERLEFRLGYLWGRNHEILQRPEPATEEDWRALQKPDTDE